MRGIVSAWFVPAQARRFDGEHLRHARPAATRPGHPEEATIAHKMDWL